MSEKYNISSLFDISGNLTLDAMERYQKGMLTPADRDRVEKHLAESDFDREAFEGIQKHGTAGLRQEVAGLKAEIHIASGKSVKKVSLQNARRIYWYAAAGLTGLICISLLMYFLFRIPLDRTQLAVVQPDTIIDKTTASAGVEENSQMMEKENIQEVKPQEVSPEPVRPEPANPVVNTDLEPEPMQKEGLQEPVEPPGNLAIVENDVLTGEAAIIEDKTVGGIAISGENDFAGKMNNRKGEAPAVNYEIQAKTAFAVSDESMVVERGSDDEIFMVVEQMPEFPGGEKSLNQYLSDSLHYPQTSRESGIQGRVFVTFVVNPDGSISDVRVLRGIGGGCDEEAIRVIKSMPNWIPGKQRGVPVRVQYNLPVKFSLE